AVLHTLALIDPSSLSLHDALPILAGLQPVQMNEPLCHVNYFEAHAFACWSQKRLPTEFEWEVASTIAADKGHFLDPLRLHPQPRSEEHTSELQSRENLVCRLLLEK